MQISNMCWKQVETYLETDDRCILPLGCTEQHAYLSLSVDTILAERMACEAGELMGVPVFPALAYTPTPSHSAFPGTVSIRLETLLCLVNDIVHSLYKTGFRRIIIINGHGGNSPISVLSQELMGQYFGLSIKFHSWWNSPQTTMKAAEIGDMASHANWFENFPWTRLAHARPPSKDKKPIDEPLLDISSPQAAKEMLGDGSYGGAYAISDDLMLDLWATALKDTCDIIGKNWPERPS